MFWFYCCFWFFFDLAIFSVFLGIFRFISCWNYFTILLLFFIHIPQNVFGDGVHSFCNYFFLSRQSYLVLWCIDIHQPLLFFCKWQPIELLDQDVCYLWSFLNFHFSNIIKSSFGLFWFQSSQLLHIRYGSLWFDFLSIFVAEWRVRYIAVASWCLLIICSFRRALGISKLHKHIFQIINLSLHVVCSLFLSMYNRLGLLLNYIYTQVF